MNGTEDIEIVNLVRWSADDVMKGKNSSCASMIPSSAMSSLLICEVLKKGISILNNFQPSYSNDFRTGLPTPQNSKSDTSAWQDIDIKFLRRVDYQWFDISSALIINFYKAKSAINQPYTTEQDKMDFNGCYLAYQTIHHRISSQDRWQNEISEQIKCSMMGLLFNLFSNGFPNAKNAVIAKEENIIRTKLSQCIAEIIKRNCWESILLSFKERLAQPLNDFEQLDVALRTLYILGDEIEMATDNDMDDENGNLLQRRNNVVHSSVNDPKSEIKNIFIQHFHNWILPSLCRLVEQYMISANYSAQLKQSIQVLEVYFKWISLSILLDHPILDLFEKVINNYPDISVNEKVLGCIEAIVSRKDVHLDIVERFFEKILIILSNVQIKQSFQNPGLKLYTLHKILANSLSQLVCNHLDPFLSILKASKKIPEERKKHLVNELYQSLLSYSAHPSVILFDSLIPGWKELLIKSEKMKDYFSSLIPSILNIFVDSLCITITGNDSLEGYFIDDGYDVEEDELILLNIHSNHVLEIVGIIAAQHPLPCVQFIEMRLQHLRSFTDSSEINFSLPVINQVIRYLAHLPQIISIISINCKNVSDSQIKDGILVILERILLIYFDGFTKSSAKEDVIILSAASSALLDSVSLADMERNLSLFVDIREKIICCIQSSYDLVLLVAIKIADPASILKCFEYFFSPLSVSKSSIVADIVSRADNNASKIGENILGSDTVDISYRLLRDSCAQALKDWCTKMNDKSNPVGVTLLSQLLPHLIQQVLVIIRSSTTSPSENVALFEMLVIASQSLNDPVAKHALLNDIIKDSMIFVESTQMQELLGDRTSQNLASQFQLFASSSSSTMLSALGKKQQNNSMAFTSSSNSMIIEQDLAKLPLVIQQTRLSFRTILGVAKAAGGNKEDRVALIDKWPTVLPIAAKVIESIHSLWQNIENRQKCEDFINLYPIEMRYLFGYDHPLFQNCQNLRFSSNQSQQKQYMFSIAAWLTIMRDLLYAMIGFVADSGLFLNQPDLFQATLSPILFSSTNSIELMENRHLTKLIHAILIPIAQSLDNDKTNLTLYPVLVKILVPVSQHVATRLQKYSMNETRIGSPFNPTLSGILGRELDSVKSEWMSELNDIIINHLSTAHVDLLKTMLQLIQSRNGATEQIEIERLLIILMCEQLILPFATSCNKAVQLCNDLMLPLLQKQQNWIFLPRYLLPAILYALLRPRCKLNDGSQLALVDLFTDVYCFSMFRATKSDVVANVVNMMQPNSKKPKGQLPLMNDETAIQCRDFCGTIPKISVDHLQKFEARLQSESISDKKQRAISREFLEQCFSASYATMNESSLDDNPNLKDSILRVERKKASKNKNKSSIEDDSFGESRIGFSGKNVIPSPSNTKGDWTQAIDAWDLGVVRLFSSSKN